MKHGVIEISISGVELMLADSDDKKEVKVVLNDRTALVVSEYFKSKRLLKGGADEIIQTVLKYKKKAETYGVTAPLGIILSFVEELENKTDILERLKTETGIEFKILQKDTIELCAKLVEKRELGKEGLIIIDSGKGGLRLADVSGEEVDYKYIPALGSTKISGEFVRSILPVAKEIELIKKYITKKLKTKLLKKKYTAAILSGNAAISLAKMYADFYSEKYTENTFIIKTKKFKKLFDSLVQNPKRATLISRYAPERINTVLCNMLVLIKVIKKLGVREAAIRNYSYMEGYIYGLVNNCLEVPKWTEKKVKTEEKKEIAESKTSVTVKPAAAEVKVKPVVVKPASAAVKDSAKPAAVKKPAVSAVKETKSALKVTEVKPSVKSAEVRVITETKKQTKG